VTIRTWIATLTEFASEHGGTVEHTRAGHLVIKLPNGGLVHAASTPSDWRSVANARADIRRAAATAPRARAAPRRAT
jgi:hypothetical protein